MKNEIEQLTYLISELKREVEKLKVLSKQPQPIYLNQKEGARLLRVKDEVLKKAYDLRFIKRHQRHGEGFVYKITELLQLGEAIDQGLMKI